MMFRNLIYCDRLDKKIQTFNNRETDFQDLGPTGALATEYSELCSFEDVGPAITRISADRTWAWLPQNKI